jgi:CheY-like chemotaxis protein
MCSFRDFPLSFAELMTTDSQLRVLYVDDDEIALNITQCQLLRVDIHTEITSDVVEAVSFLTTQPIDLILLDSVMPTIDGVEFLQLIRSLNLEHPVIFLSGFDLEELKNAVAEYEVVGFLDKQTHRLNLPNHILEMYNKHLAHSA